jgi:DNA-binding NarL/FixJ family response regulator
MKPITVLLSEDHTLVREALRLLLEAAGDIQVVGEAADGHQSVQEAKRLRPDVVLQDLGMPLLNGVEATRQISREVPSVKVLILSAYGDDQRIEHAVEAGAASYLMKEARGQDLLQAIRKVAKGDVVFSPSVAQRMDFSIQRRDGSRARGPLRMKIRKLTSRQTVERHRQDLRDTLNMHTIATLTRYAVMSGVVESNSTPILSVIGSTRSEIKLENSLDNEMATA